MRETVWNEKRSERGLVSFPAHSYKVCDGRGRVGILIVVCTMIG